MKIMELSKGHIILLELWFFSETIYKFFSEKSTHRVMKSLHALEETGCCTYNKGYCNQRLQLHGFGFGQGEMPFPTWCQSQLKPSAD